MEETKTWKKVIGSAGLVILAYYICKYIIFLFAFGIGFVSLEILMDLIPTTPKEFIVEGFMIFCMIMGIINVIKWVKSRRHTPDLKGGMRK